MKLALLTVTCLSFASAPAMAECPTDIPEKFAKVNEIFAHYPQSVEDADRQLRTGEPDLQNISHSLQNCSCLGAWKTLDNALTALHSARDSKIDYQQNIFDAYDLTKDALRIAPFNYALCTGQLTD